MATSSIFNSDMEFYEDCITYKNHSNNGINKSFKKSFEAALTVVTLTFKIVLTRALKAHCTVWPMVFSSMQKPPFLSPTPLLIQSHSTNLLPDLDLSTSCVLSLVHHTTTLPTLFLTKFCSISA